jgi:hypothetical protein
VSHPLYDPNCPQCNAEGCECACGLSAACEHRNVTYAGTRFNAGGVVIVWKCRNTKCGAEAIERVDREPEP